MPVLRSATYRRMPWKNGGGETLEIAASPEGASLDAFDWRISMAVVASDGPFSSFPGVDRTLSILDGKGIELAVATERFVLTRASMPRRFAADVPASARLLAGTVTDLNVMTNRARYRHEVRRVGSGIIDSMETNADVVLIFCSEGFATCRTLADETLTLQARDCAVLTAPGKIGIATRPGTAVLLAGIYRTTVTPV